MTDLHPLLLTLLLAVLAPAAAFAQPDQSCCIDATCTWCWEVSECETAVGGLADPSNAVAGGTEACGVDLPFGPVLCSSFTENNLVGGVCLPSCNDATACNYDASAPNDIDCTYPDECEDCDGNCLNDANGNGTCDCCLLYTSDAADE